MNRGTSGLEHLREQIRVGVLAAPVSGQVRFRPDLVGVDLAPVVRRQSGHERAEIGEVGRTGRGALREVSAATSRPAGRVIDQRDDLKVVRERLLDRKVRVVGKSAWRRLDAVPGDVDLDVPEAQLGDFGVVRRAIHDDAVPKRRPTSVALRLGRGTKHGQEQSNESEKPSQ